MSKNKNAKTQPQNSEGNEKSLKAQKAQSPAQSQTETKAAKAEKAAAPKKAAASKAQPKLKNKAAGAKAKPKAKETAAGGETKAEKVEAVSKVQLKAEDKIDPKTEPQADAAAKRPETNEPEPADKPKKEKKAEGCKRRKKRHSKKLKSHLLSKNPAFVKALAIVPILGAAVSLKNGILLSCAMILTVVLLNIIAYPLNKVVPENFRPAAEFLVAGIVFTPVYMLACYFAPSVTTACGIYLPLIAVSALPLIEKKYYGKKYGFVKTAVSAGLDGLGFAFAAIIFSVIREIIGSGTLYGRPLPYVSGMKFSFALMPAGAFLLLGVLMALFKKIYPAGDREGSK